MGLILMTLVILGDLFAPPTGIPLFSILYFGWKYIKMKIKMDVYLTYLLFLGVPQIALMTLFRIIEIPFKGSLKLADKLEDELEYIKKGAEFLEHHPKKGLIMALISGVLMFATFAPSLTSLASSLTGGVTSILQTLLILLGGALLPVIIILGIYEWISSHLGSGESARDQLDSMYTDPGAGNEMKEAREMRENLHEGKKAAGKAVEAAEEGEGILGRLGEFAKSCVPKNVTSIGTDLVETLPIPIGPSAKRTAERTGASEASEIGYEAAAEETAVIAEESKAVGLLPLTIAALILLVFQALLIGAIFMFVIHLYMPIIGGPMMAALGFSTDYATYGSQALQPYMPNIDMSPFVTMIQGPIAKAQCFFEGPQCLTEWKMNNTQRPGSEEEGQTYDLKSSGFEIEQGQTIDAAYQPPDRSLSVAFALENPMYGLKGIAARDVQYNVLVNDNAGEQVCGTDFIPINLYQRDSIEPTTIPPGDSYSAGAAIQEPEAIKEQLTMLKCGLLQPGQAKLTRTAELQYMYDYSSQSNLRIKAMSYQNYADKNLDRVYKKSETADTPVKSYVNVYAPVLFDEMQDGTRKPRPFEVQIGLETDDLDVKYRVDPESIRFTPSRATEVAGNCDDFTPISTSERDITTYKLDDSGIDQIRRETFENDRWYTKARSPSVMECTLSVSNPDQISASGETLIMDVSADYTVIKEGITDQFQAWNTLCSGLNCPLLVPENRLSGLDESKREGFLTSCDPGKRATAVGGCDVRNPGISSEGAAWQEEKIEDAWLTPQIPGSDIINFERIDEGETAYDWNMVVKESGDAIKSFASIQKTDGKPVIGLTEDRFERVTSIDQEAPPAALYVTESGGVKDTEFRQIDWRTVCADQFEGNKTKALNRFTTLWEERNYAESVLYLKPKAVTSSCNPSGGGLIDAIAGIIGQTKQERYESVKNNCNENNGVLTVVKGGFQCYYN